MHVIAGPKDIYDHSGEVVDFARSDLSSLNAVEGDRVCVAEDSFCFGFDCCWGVFEASQLLDGFFPIDCGGFCCGGSDRG